jgi:hypothetical protein
MRCALLLSLAIGLTTAAPARAQARVTLVPSMSVSSTYDNNLFTTEVASRDEMLLITPGLEAYYESPSVTLQSLYSFDAQRAVGHPVLNMLQARRHGLVETGWKTTPQLRLSFAGRYDVTESPGELNFETGVLLGRRRASRWQTTPALAYQITPRVILNAQYDLTKESLAESINGEMQVVRTGFTRQQTPRHTWTASYLGRTFQNGPDVYRSHALLAGWTWAVAPGVALSVQAGPRVTSYGSRMPEVLATFAKRARLVRIGADYWQGETIVLGIRGPVQLQSTTVKTAWPLRRTIEVGAHAGIFHIETLQKAAARVFHGELVGSWSPHGAYVVAASYGVDFQKGDVRSPLLSEKQVMRHVFLVRMTVAPRWSSAFRPRDPNDPTDPITKGVMR